jgi:HK97 family phage major capsid protein
MKRLTLNPAHVLWAIAAMLLVAVIAALTGHPIVPLDVLGGIGGSALPFFVGETKTIADQISAFETKRTEAQSKMDTIMQKAADEGRTLDESETEEYDEAKADLATVEKHLERLKEHEKAQIARGKAVDANAGRGEGAPRDASGGTTVDIGGGSGSGVLSVRRNLAKGTAFTRYAMVLASSKGNLMQAEVLAQRFKDTPEVALTMKSAVAAGTTTDATWAGPLVYYNNMVDEFIELLRPQTVLGRLTGLRRVPFNIRIPRQTAGSIGTFVGEGAPTPVRKLDFDAVTLPWAKCSTIVVLSAELVKLSNPAAEALARQDLLAGIAQYLDKRLLDPGFAGVANVSPASLTYGVAARQASGASLAAIDSDTKYVMQQFAASELGVSGAVWVTSPSEAIGLSKIRNSYGMKEYPQLTMNGGEWEGLPMLTSNNVLASASPGDEQLIAINQPEVLLADDNTLLLDVSTEASVQMNDAPTAGAQSLVSLWQNGLLGVKVDRFIYWMKRRDAAVQIIDAAQRYGS